MNGFLKTWRTAGPLTRSMLITVALMFAVAVVLVAGGVAFLATGAPRILAALLALLSLLPFGLSLVMYRRTVSRYTEY